MRADWLAARALLASRRLRPLVPAGLLLFALVFTAVFAVRAVLANGAAATRRVADRSEIVRQDTLPLAAAVQAARALLALRDSAFQALLFRGAERVAAPALSPETQRTRDSLRVLLDQLDGALDRTTKAPLAASYRVLANTRALHSMDGVPALVDTLDLLDRARLALDPVEAPPREFAELSQRANVIGSRLQEIGQARHAALVRAISTLEESAWVFLPTVAFVADSSRRRLARDSARASVGDAEARLRAARQWNDMARARADSATHARSARILGASPVALALSVLLVAGVLVFTLVVTAEARHPTIAHAREVERLVEVPVLATAHPGHLPAEGRARLQPGDGIDPFRMVYLALTASGTRERTVCITGDDPGTVAAVAGRLAVSAAADARATLVVDAAPGTPSVTRYFGVRDAPGFSEAIAAIRLWREVTRPAGASEGLGLDVVPAGDRRADTRESVAMESNCREFHLFASEYDFTIVAAPTRDSLATVVMLCTKPATIYVARVARTPLDTITEEIRALRSADLDLYGVLLVDAG